MKSPYPMPIIMAAIQESQSEWKGGNMQMNVRGNSKEGVGN